MDFSPYQYANKEGSSWINRAKEAKARQIVVHSPSSYDAAGSVVW